MVTFKFSYLSRAFHYSMLLIITSCCSGDPTPKTIVTEEKIFWVNIVEDSPLIIPALVSVPEGEGPYPAIVVLHGCGGLLKDGSNETLESHFNHWIEFGKQNGVVMIFPDSFNPRGFSEFCGMAPPEDAICSPAYERPKDALRVLNWLAKEAYVDSDRIGLIGFSHGASTAIATIFDNRHTQSKIWKVVNNGIEYLVPAPATSDKKLSYKAASVYYPGAGFYDYFGSDYLPSVPLQIHAAELDPLYTSGNVDKLVQYAQQNGANIQNGNPVELYVYTGAQHSFDGASSGADADASTLAKQRTAMWLLDYLKK